MLLTMCYNFVNISVLNFYRILSIYYTFEICEKIDFSKPKLETTSLMEKNTIQAN